MENSNEPKVPTAKTGTLPPDSSWFKYYTAALSGFGARRKYLIEEMRMEERLLGHHIIAHAASYMNKEAQAEHSLLQASTQQVIDSYRDELLAITRPKSAKRKDGSKI